MNTFIINSDYHILDRHHQENKSATYLHLLKVNEYDDSGNITSIHHLDITYKDMITFEASEPFLCQRDLLSEVVMRMYFPYGTLSDYYIEYIFTDLY